MLVTTWAISGCSDSGGSVSNESVSGDSSLISTAPSTSTTSSGSDVDVSNDPIVPAETELPTDLIGEENTEKPLNEPVINSPVVTDPLIQNNIVVDFGITVPAYQSNELRIELVWGDINLNAMWVGDEYWSASGEFPTQTEEMLTVTFYDLNGAMELARFSEPFRTGSNATESFQIPATQFDADQFDTDADGVSNLAELIAGTSPIVQESLSDNSNQLIIKLAGYQMEQLGVLVDLLASEIIETLTAETLTGTQLTSGSSQLDAATADIQRQRYSCPNGGTMIYETASLDNSSSSTNINGYSLTNATSPQICPH